MNNNSQYRINEIKYKIDTVIQTSMFKTNKENWKIILDIQNKLYEKFDIED